MSKEKVEFDPVAYAEEIKDLIKEASDQRTLIEHHSENIKDIKKRAKEEYGMPTKTFNQMFAIYHNQTRERFENEKDEVLDAYDQVFAE